MAKSVIALGLGREGTRVVEVDERFRMRAEDLRKAIRDDQDAGIRPLAVVATLGTTSTTSMDPVAEIAEVALESGAWLHVDAAYAGPAAMVPELRDAFDGWEHADSIVLNPHKWLFTPVDCSILYTRWPDRLKEAFSLTPAYLTTKEGDEATNLMDYGVALGRRFRALKLWFVLRYFGRRGLENRIRHALGLASEFTRWVDEAPEWRRIAPVPFSTVVFRFEPTGTSPERQDAMNMAILDRVNASGAAFLSHTVLGGRTCLRVAIGNLKTRRAHLEKAWAGLQEAADQVRAVRPL